MTLRAAPALILAAALALILAQATLTTARNLALTLDQARTLAGT